MNLKKKKRLKYPSYSLIVHNFTTLLILKEILHAIESVI